MSEHNFEARGNTGPGWFKATWNEMERTVSLWQNWPTKPKIWITLSQKDFFEIWELIKRDQCKGFL